MFILAIFIMEIIMRKSSPLLAKLVSLACHIEHARESLSNRNTGESPGSFGLLRIGLLLPGEDLNSPLRQHCRCTKRRA